MSPPADAPAPDHDPGHAAFLDDASFAALMAPLGPWPARHDSAAPVAVAVSGGADSLCLAVLAATWAAGRGLPLLALVVDHGLRADSAREALDTVARLGAIAIPSQLLTLRGLSAGPALAARARVARYDALLCACREAGVVDLLLGHHAFDQAETVLMRRRAASGPAGLAGMAPLLELDAVRLLRPLLSVPPARLRATLLRRGLAWVEDPSNRDRRAERTRSRESLRADPSLRRTLLEQCGVAGMLREQARWQEAASLAEVACLRPEGFALLPPTLPPAGALAALVRTVGGRAHRPAAEAIERLSRRPRAATLAGTQLLPAGRLGPGWLLVREADAMQRAVPAAPCARWDDRFVLLCDRPLPDGSVVSAVGADGAQLRPASRLPAAVLRTLPALRDGDGALLAVPHLGWPGGGAARVTGVRFLFRPPAPASDSTPFTVL